MDLDRFSRTKMLFKDNFAKLQNAKILILGVGGVGGFCLDGLYRSGVCDIVIVDFDTFEITNQNRQIGSESLDEYKVEVLARKYPNIKTIKTKINQAWVDGFDFSSFDIVVDAIDDMNAKVAVALKCHEKLISATGGAKKINPEFIKTASIWKTYGDALAKKFRYELKKANFRDDFICVFSNEEPKCENLGSCVVVTGSFGLRLASLVIERILKLS